MTWSREDLAWLAGLYEGEGCVLANPLRIRISMTDEDTLRAFVARSGVGAVTGPRPATGLGKKPVWDYVVTGRKAYALLVAMLPWLGERRTAGAVEKIQAWMKRKPTTAGVVLTVEDVREIRRQLESGGHGTARRLAREYGVSDGMVSAIRHGRVWKGVMPYA